MAGELGAAAGMNPYILVGQGAIGLGQTVAGLVMASKNKRPSLDSFQKNIADSEKIYNRLNDIYTQRRAQSAYGFEKPQMNQMLSNVQGQNAVSQYNLRNSGLGAGMYNAMGALNNMNYAKGLNNIYGQDSALMQGKQRYADTVGLQTDSALRGVGQSRNALYGEQNNIFKQKAQAANAMIGAGLQNIGNVGKSAMAMQSNKDQMNMWNQMYGDKSVGASDAGKLPYSPSMPQLLQETGANIPSYMDTYNPSMNMFNVNGIDYNQRNG